MVFWPRPETKVLASFQQEFQKQAYFCRDKRTYRTFAKAQCETSRGESYFGQGQRQGPWQVFNENSKNGRIFAETRERIVLLPRHNAKLVEVSRILAKAGDKGIGKFSMSITKTGVFWPRPETKALASFQ